MTPPEDIVTGEMSECVNCGEVIYAVIDPHSGCVDWGSAFSRSDKPEDFGCIDSPDTGDEGTGSHDPGEGHTPCGFRILVDSKSYWQRIDAQGEPDMPTNDDRFDEVSGIDVRDELIAMLTEPETDDPVDTINAVAAYLGLDDYDYFDRRGQWVRYPDTEG